MRHRAEQVRRPARHRVVLRNGAAERDPPAAAQRPDGGFEVAAADVVEVDVDAVGRRRTQQVGDRRVAVVERGVEPEVVDQVRDLGVRAGAANHAVTLELRDLRRDAADRAGRGGHPDDVAGAKRGDVEQPDVRGQPDPAERAEVRLRRGGIDVDGRQRAEPAERRLAGAHGRVIAPAGRVPHVVAGREPRGAGLDHLADGQDAVERAVEREPGEVAVRSVRAQPYPQAGIDRRPGVADEHLAGPRRAHPNLGDTELRPAVRGELDLTPGAQHRSMSGQ